MSVWLAMAGLCSASGCTLFHQQSVSTPPTSAFSWLTNWASQPMETAAGFDVESLRPEPRPASVLQNDLLEVTIWDLDEPGKPYTFPVRVSERRTIEVPLLGEVSVADRSCPQVETSLIEAYKASEMLVNPRLLVRSLDPPLVKVQVSGAVQRPGYVELSRADTSVYAALVTAGGVTKSAGTRVTVLRRSQGAESGIATAGPPSSGSPRPNEPAHVVVRGQQPEQYSNSVEELTVTVPQNGSPGIRAIATALPPPADPAAGRRLAPVHHSALREPGSDYDLTKTEEREALRNLRLEEGDQVLVKAATPPVRIEGVVEHPGAYPLPPGHSVNVWQAIEIAGGVPLRDVPLNITLIHPAAEGRPAAKESLHVAEYDKHPVDAPLVHPGDVLHVAPPAGTRIKRVVGDLWSRP